MISNVWLMVNDTRESGAKLPPPPPVRVAKDTSGRAWVFVVGLFSLLLGSGGLAWCYAWYAIIPAKDFQQTYTFWEGLSSIIIATMIIPFLVMGTGAVIAGTVTLSVWGEQSRRARAGLQLSKRDPTLGVVRRVGGWLARARVPASLAIVGLFQMGESILLWGYESGIEMSLHMPFADYGQGPLATLPEDLVYAAIFAVGVWSIIGARGGRIGVMVFQGYLFLHVVYWIWNGYLLVGSNGEIGIDSNKVSVSAMVFGIAFLLAFSAREWRTS